MIKVLKASTPPCSCQGSLPPVPDDLFGDGRASSGQYFRNAGPPSDSRHPSMAPLTLRWDRVDPLKANLFLTWKSTQERTGRSAEKKNQSRKKIRVQDEEENERNQDLFVLNQKRIVS